MKGAVGQVWQWLSDVRRGWNAWRRPRSLGERGEALAARFLRRKGYTLIVRSDRGRLGEIDIVAVEGRTLVFVEVKTRRSHAKGHPADAVDRRKQRKLTRLALHFMKRHELLENTRARFDIVAITWPKDAAAQIEHYENAFEAVGKWQMHS